eukprot:TRINITY_DN95_c1_g1_i1.p1 TRINITY_DN95_c1_g1~~TRINITY_DN95_c1_g1_i1.p1  ORF type:complete len:425 (+),score=151.26 TRINITY_DN95_c1_g1_i1:102-1376(+)
MEDSKNKKLKRAGKYYIGKTLGEGSFGKVKLGQHRDTNERVAIKVLEKDKIAKLNMGAQIKKEISMMKLVNHPNVVQLKGVLVSRTKIFIVLELVTGGELFDKIVAAGRFDEDTARFYFRQLVGGVHYCHTQGVCHRDLKPENLLLDGNGDLKITDFGLSSMYKGEDSDRVTLLHTTCGTPNYVAPEVLDGKGYDGRAADVWSCGVILFVLLAGFLPFDEPTMAALFRKIKKAEFSYPKWFKPEIRDLLDTILVTDPTKRLTLGELRKHPWYTNGERVEDFETASKAPIRTPSMADIDAALEDAPEVAATPRQKVEKPAPTKKEKPATESRQFQFKSEMEPPSLAHKLAETLDQLGCAVEVSTASNKVRASVVLSSGMISLNMHCYAEDGVTLCDVRRGKGDILEYHRFYRHVLKCLGSDVIAK